MGITLPEIKMLLRRIKKIKMTRKERDKIIKVLLKKMYEHTND